MLYDDSVLIYITDTKTLTLTVTLTIYRVSIINRIIMFLEESCSVI